MSKVLELKDILDWIVQHREDTAAMDDVNRLSYPYTTHHIIKRDALLERYGQRFGIKPHKKELE